MTSITLSVTVVSILETFSFISSNCFLLAFSVSEFLFSISFIFRFILSIFPLFSFKSAFMSSMFPFSFFSRSAMDDSSSSALDFLSFLASRLISFRHLWFLYLFLTCSNLVVLSFMLIWGEVSGGDFLFLPLGETFFLGGDDSFFSRLVKETLLEICFEVILSSEGSLETSSMGFFGRFSWDSLILLIFTMVTPWNFLVTSRGHAILRAR